MYKEIIISTIIIAIVFIGNNISQGYTDKTIEEIDSNLSGVREKIFSNIDENKNNSKEEIKKDIERILSKWEEKYYVLAIYIEHDELEKVKKELVSLRASVDVEEYQDAVGDADRGMFALEHLKDKEILNLDNFF